MAYQGYIVQVPVISAAHLKRRTYQHLRRLVRDYRHAGALYRQGIWIWALECGDSDYPPDARELFAWARKNFFNWVRLDYEIGDIVPDLPILWDE